MIKIVDYLDDIEINPPVGAKPKIKFNFDKDSKDYEGGGATLGTLELIGFAAQYVYQWYFAGKISGVGVFEGIPYRREIHNASDPPLVLFNGFLDMSDNPELSCDNCKIKTRERRSVDAINQVNHKVTLEYLYKVTGELKDADFDWMPYVRNPVHNNIDIILALLTIGYTAQQIDAATDKLIELASEAANPLEATAIIRITIFEVYLIVLLFALGKLIVDLITMLVQPVKYHACMNVRRQFEIFATHFGYNFSSPGFLDTSPYREELFIMPRKYYVATNSDDVRLLGFTKPQSIEQVGYFKGTFGQFVQAIKSVYDFKIIISDDGKEMKAVKQNYNPGTPVAKLPPVLNRKFTLNTDKFKSNREFTFQVDLSDRNTIQKYTGTSVQIITTPIHYNNKDLVLMTGFDQRNALFALAKEKTELTFIEELIRDFLIVFDDLVNTIVSAINEIIDIVNDVIGFLNDILDDLSFVGIDLNFKLPTIDNIPTINIAGTIGNRVGMMLLENDSFNVDKLFMMRKSSNENNYKYNKISPNNATHINAEYIQENFHTNENFVPGTGRPFAAQGRIYDFQNVPFVYSQYLNTRENKFIFDSDNNECEILSGEWDAEFRLADLKVKIPELYTKNLQEQKLIPTGA